MLFKRKSQVYLFWGIHGNEGIITSQVANCLVNKLSHIDILDTYVIGPVSPWSYRNGYRFDRTMSDPNRIISCETPHNKAYFQLLKEWRVCQPKDIEQINNFLIRINQIGLDIGQLFNYCQTTDQDFFGYVNAKVQNKRVDFLTQLITREINLLNPSKITLIDLHAGIGKNAETILFYEGNGKLIKKKFLIDAIASNIYQSFGRPVRTMILETGVVNNHFGLINILSEIATRTYGFNQPIPRINQVVSDEWMSKTMDGLDIKILGDL